MTTATETERAPSAWGDNVKRQRERLRMTQGKLADECNVTPTTISRIERGIEVPRYGLMHRLATALHMELDQLFPYPKIWGKR